MLTQVPSNINVLILRRPEEDAERLTVAQRLLTPIFRRTISGNDLRDPASSFPLRTLSLR